MPANVAYLTGFEGVFDAEAASVALVTQDELIVVTDTRYVEACASCAEGEAWEVTLSPKGLWAAVAEAFAERFGEGKLAVEQTLSLGTFRKLEETLGGRVEAVESWVEQSRRVKDADEIDRIDAAQQLTDAAFEYVLGMLGAGVSEATIALDLEFFMRRNGSEGIAFDPIVASGPNSSRPHAVPGDRVLQPGDFVVLDFGARVDGYCADMTRTVVVGSASDEQRAMYDAVREANLAGIAHVSAEHTGLEAHNAASEVLGERGYGEYFTHGLGHGVGREVHEMPALSPRGGDEKLQAGEVVTVEPGVYVPGFGGVRIEDLVVVEERGRRVLTASTKDLIEV